MATRSAMVRRTDSPARQVSRNVKAARSLPLGDLAYQRIKDDIVKCVVAPGTEFTEADLAERYKLGKAPIRSALSRLTHEGLTQVQPRKGYRVAPITLDAVRDVFELRVVLESEAARLAAGRLSEKQMKRMRAVCQMKYRPGNRESEAAFLAANRAFHLTIAEASGNQRLCSVIARLLDDVERMLHLGLARGEKGGEFQGEHIELLHALMVNDSERAVRLVHEQIRGGSRMVMENLLTKVESSDSQDEVRGESEPMVPKGRS